MWAQRHEAHRGKTDCQLDPSQNSAEKAYRRTILLLILWGVLWPILPLLARTRRRSRRKVGKDSTISSSDDPAIGIGRRLAREERRRQDPT